MKYAYVPIIKTNPAELKGFSNLPIDVFNNILPVIELTRSRRSKNNPNASIYKNLDTIIDIIGTNPFILDLTTDETLINNEIEGILYDGGNGFTKWVDLIITLKNSNMNPIPIIHYDPNEIQYLSEELNALQDLSSILAFRVSINDSNIQTYLENIQESFDLKKPNPNIRW